MSDFKLFGQRYPQALANSKWITYTVDGEEITDNYAGWERRLKKTRGWVSSRKRAGWSDGQALGFEDPPPPEEKKLLSKVKPNHNELIKKFHRRKLV